MSKRANGDGSFYFDEKKQTYRAMITTPVGNRFTKSSKNKAIVQDWLNEQRFLVGRGQHIEPNSITLKQWLDKWLLVYAKVKVKPRTYDRYESLLKHLTPLYMHKLKDLNPAHLQRIITSMMPIYSARTIIHVCNCLSGCLQQAVMNGLIRDNIARKVQKPKAAKKELEIFIKEEQSALLEECKNHRNALVVPLALGTGLRLSEVLALRCEDIKENSLTVNQTIHVSKSNRTILISVDLVRQIKEHQMKHNIREGLLFFNTRGACENIETYLRFVFKKIQTATSTNKNFHCFRHTCATIFGLFLAQFNEDLG